jgi:hypothetical protein
MDNGTLTSAFSSALKLHASGYIHNASGQLLNRGEIGYFWSSSQNSNTGGWYLVATGFTSAVSNVSVKAFAFPLRCLKD